MLVACLKLGLCGSYSFDIDGFVQVLSADTVLRKDDGYSGASFASGSSLAAGVMIVVSAE